MRLLTAKPSRRLLDQQGQKVDYMASDDVVYFVDWYGRSWFESMIASLGRPQLVICDVEASWTPQPVPQVFIPALQMGTFQTFRSEMNATVNFVHSDTNTRTCFNFSINKKCHDRFLLLKVIQWFELHSYQYTWSGLGNIMDMSPVLNELQQIQQPAWYTSDFASHILSPITGIDVRWFDIKDHIESKLECNSAAAQGQRNLSGNIWTQWDLFKRELTETSAVTVLCDGSTDLEPNFSVTERLLHAAAGLTFVIYAGNYGQAAHMQRMGVDVFSEVIDHSYQWRPTLLERVYYAIHDNLKILHDLDHAHHTRIRYLDRLLHNRTYLSGNGIDKWIADQYLLVPDNVRPLLMTLDQLPDASGQ